MLEYIDLLRVGNLFGIQAVKHLAQLHKWLFQETPRGQVLAELNHGRWIAHCPLCAGAELVSPGVPFYCLSCGMRLNDGHVMQVEFPEDAEQIEAAVRTRAVANKNWVHGETVHALLEANRIKGVA
jgi:hypothetical protein